jgi:hypothetical protein
VGMNNRKRCRGAVGCLIVAGLLWLTAGGSAVTAGTAWTQTSRTDFESGTLMYLDASSSPGDVRLGVAGVNYLYAFRGYNQKTFWRYDLAANAWTALANAPDRVKWGGSLAYDDGDYIYAFRGNNSSNFWRYSISANSWAAMAGAPGTVGEGGALTYNNGYIYALRGNDTKDFWRYDIFANTWTSRASTAENILKGGTLTSDGGNYIYSFQCETTRAFWRYDIAADSWTLLADVPEILGAGAALAYDGSRYIYAQRGGYKDDFWRYDTVTDAWSFKADIPSVVGWGGALAFDGGSYVYALAGGYTQQFWRYDIAADAWEWRTSTPCSVSYGGALVRGGATYYASGELTSAPHDTGYNADFGTVSWSVTLPPGTTVKFQVAANNDNATWDFKGPDGAAGTYYTTSGTAVWPGHDGGQYIKYKAYFSTTDIELTPVLHDVTIAYSQQILLPSVVTEEASPVEETTATLHGAVADDGGETCQYRFQYGTAPGNYTADTGWNGNVTTGESFSVPISGLGKGTKYYYRAQVKNSTGTGSGGELSLLTKPDAPVAGTFKATAVSNTQINLTWVKGDGAQRTMVRRGTAGYPADINDGALVYFDTGTSVADTGLSPATTYYYSAWSEVTGSQQWSNSSQAATATTNAGPPMAVGGVVFRANKAVVMAPWLGMALLLLAGGGAGVGWWKKVRR